MCMCMCFGAGVRGVRGDIFRDHVCSLDCFDQNDTRHLPCVGTACYPEGNTF